MRDDTPFEVNALGMRCPWPALRAARAMRDHGAVRVIADDPIASRELESLAQECGWSFKKHKENQFIMAHVVTENQSQ